MPTPDATVPMLARSPPPWRLERLRRVVEEAWMQLALLLMRLDSASEASLRMHRGVGRRVLVLIERSISDSPRAHHVSDLIYLPRIRWSTL